MVAPIQPRQKVEYKRPGRINVVSVSVALVMAAGVYLLLALWPVISLRSNAEGELADALPHLWRNNLRPVETSSVELPKLKQQLTERLRKVGVKDPKLQVVFERGRKKVAIEARFSTSASLPGLDKTLTFALAPRVETDAARVDW